MPKLAVIDTDQSSTTDAASPRWWASMGEAVTRASSGAQLVCIPETGTTGGYWTNLISAETGYSGELDEVLAACRLHGLVGLVERITNDIRNPYAHSVQQISERLEACIDQFGSNSPSLRALSDSTLIEVKGLASWLSQLDNNTFATVTEDGIIALEASVGIDARLFVEIDRDGTVEAAIVTSGSGIQGIIGTTISELTSDIMVRLVGRP